MEKRERERRNAAIYTRVSTLEQAATGYSLDAQESKLREYAKRQDYEVVGVYRDDGYSGATLRRPALGRLFDDVDRGKIDVVLIYKLDRLSRKVKNTLELIDRLSERGAEIFSLTERIDLASPFGRAALKMSATFSELERETIIERSKLGKEQAVKSGRYLFSAPFGYRYDPRSKSYTVVPEEAEAVKTVYRKYLEGYSVRALSEYCKENFDHPYFDSPLCCKAILKRPLYAGFFEYKGGLYRAENLSPIIDYGTYLAAREKAEKNRTQRTRESSPYLLTGLLYCGECGNRYVGKLYVNRVKNKDGEVRETTRRVYGCAARVKRDKRYRPAACGNEIVPADLLEAIVERQLRYLTFRDDGEKEEAEPFSDRRARDAEALREKQKRLLDLYLDGGLLKEVYLEKDAAIEEKIAEIERAESGESENRGDHGPRQSELIEYAENYGALSRSEQRKFLAAVIRRIVIDGDKIVVEWKFR